MNFPRIVIIVMLLASCVLGWFLYETTNELKQVEADLGKAPVLAHEIQELGFQLKSLQEARDKDGMTGQASPEYYISSVATNKRIAIGQVNISSSESRPKGMKGVIDKKYRIKPASKTKPFHRSQIGNFLYQLEADSRRIRVTTFKLQPQEKLKPGDIGNDQWFFDAEVTSREKEGS